ncbi:DUF2842 domain-containing protein [uncultured Pelagimonas sp.]|uniref:DUF2842 domain-containing protein n=1 Tax=uncultured Pelagimonas sp. TaxID=1618102 RepID=UPI0026201F42|nr:DUF2842 domain-containing protein [uncultured Pelagimonas sp.]
MALSYKARRRWSLVILLIGMPIYIMVAVTVANRVGVSDLPKVVELVIYVALGVGWVFPLKPIFLGIGQADPDADPEQDPKE